MSKITLCNVFYLVNFLVDKIKATDGVSFFIFVLL
jgi:hypothetical protein